MLMIPPITQRKNRPHPCACMPTPISAAPAMMKNTPLSVTIAIVEAKAKTSEAKPSAISKTPKATMAPHLPRSRSIAAPRLCGARLGFIVLDMALLRIDELS